LLNPRAGGNFFFFFFLFELNSPPRGGRLNFFSPKKGNHGAFYTGFFPQKTFFFFSTFFPKGPPKKKNNWIFLGAPGLFLAFQKLVFLFFFEPPKTPFKPIRAGGPPFCIFRKARKKPRVKRNENKKRGFVPFPKRAFAFLKTPKRGHGPLFPPPNPRPFPGEISNKNQKKFRQPGVFFFFFFFLENLFFRFHPFFSFLKKTFFYAPKRGGLLRPQVRSSPRGGGKTK